MMAELHQVNASHSPVSTLPPEILSLIFQYACPVPDLNKRYRLPELPQESMPPREKRTQFVLSAVSVYWRQVSTLLTPSLWTSVDIFAHLDAVDEVSEILRVFLAYSRQLPIAIGLDFIELWERYEFDAGVLVDPSIDTVLYENTHRIQELYLEFTPDAWIDLLPSLRNLNHLSIRYPDDRVPETIQSRCSNLTLKPFVGRPRLSCSKLTILHMHRPYPSYCLEMLVACPNLIEFRAQEPAEDDSEAEETLPEDSFVLPYMEVFEWSVNTRFLTDAAMLEHIRMPVLRELVWVEEVLSSFGTADDPINIFFRNLPPTLVDLHIHNPGVYEEESALASVFDYVCNSLNIESLTLSDIDGPFLSHVLRRLSSAPEMAGSQQSMRLPKLKAILIKKDFTLLERHQYKILQMLEFRFSALSTLNQDEPFRLEFPSQVVWSSRFKTKLKKMIRRGLKIEIYEETGPVNWL